MSNYMNFYETHGYMEQYEIDLAFSDLHSRNSYTIGMIPDFYEFYEENKELGIFRCEIQVPYGDNETKEAILKAADEIYSLVQINYLALVTVDGDSRYTFIDIMICPLGPDSDDILGNYSGEISDMLTNIGKILDYWIE